MKKNIFLVLMILIICAALQAKQKKAAEPSPDVKSGLQVVIEPAGQLYGVPFSLRITGLKANETVTAAAESIDAAQVEWQKGELDSMRHFYAWDKIDPAVIDKATIKVEKIKGPVLLVSGTDDQTWPSSDFSHMVMQRLEKFKHPYEYKHLKYEGAGHKVFLPYLITGGSRTFIGGTPRANAHGGMNSWAEMLDFLHRHLNQ